MTAEEKRPLRWLTPSFICVAKEGNSCRVAKINNPAITAKAATALTGFPPKPPEFWMRLATIPFVALLKITGATINHLKIIMIFTSNITHYPDLFKAF